MEKAKPHARGTSELDVYAEQRLGNHVSSLACECKHWKSSVPQAAVQTFRTVLADTGIDAGYVISTSGFQSGARDAARHTNVRLVNWSEFVGIFASDGPALGPGLRASAEVVGGHIEFLGPDGSVLPWMANTIITSGWIRRRAVGGLELSVQTRVPIPALQAVNDEVGFSGFSLSTPQDALSTDPAMPTPLTGRIEFATPPGMPGLHPVTGEKISIPFGTRCRLDVSASCALDGTRVMGNWGADIEINGSRLPMRLPGSFALRLL